MQFYPVLLVQFYLLSDILGISVFDGEKTRVLYNCRDCYSCLCYFVCAWIFAPLFGSDI